MPGSVTIRLTSAGASPNDVTVKPGGEVEFENEDAVTHLIASDPHPTHEQCPALNVGSIAPGAKATTTMPAQPATCGFHDHLDPENAAFHGTVRVAN